MQSTFRQKLGESNMSQIFDTLKYTKRAIAAGLSQEAAEFHAEELATVINDSLVTKDHLDTKLTSELVALENRLVWKLLSGLSVLMGIGISVITILSKMGVLK